MKPVVSIIMPNYNGERFIKQAVDSVIDQDFEHWELIIVDDASTDKSRTIIKTFSDDRIKYYFHDHNRGVAAARNTALSNALGRYICFLDSDDFWQHNKISQQLSALENTSCAVSHASYYLVTVKGDIVSQIDCKKHVTYRDMLRHNYIGNLTGLYDSKKIGVILQKNIRHEDYAMWLTLVKNSCSIGITEPLGFYRKHASSLSANKFKSIWWSFCVLRQHEGLPVFYAAFNTFIHICIKLFRL